MSDRFRNVIVGICGFAASRSKCYSLVDAVEVQKIFYKFPREDTVVKWRAEAPEGFEFILKASQLITHPASSPTYRKAKLQIPEEKRQNYGFFRPTDEVFEAWEMTARFAKALKAKVVVFQTPASFDDQPQHVENLLGFFKAIDRHGLILGWEPRGNWSEDTLRQVFEELSLIHIVDPFKNRPLWGEIAYFRLHGLGKGYRYEFSDDELRMLISMIPEDKPVYVMFNNTNMLNDAVKLKKLLEEG